MVWLSAKEKMFRYNLDKFTKLRVHFLPSGLAWNLGRVWVYWSVQKWVLVLVRQ